METRDKLIIAAEILIVVSAIAGTLESSIAESSNDVQRDSISANQNALMYLQEANRVCNKYYEVAEYKDGDFYPADSVEVSFEGISRALEKENLSVGDLDNDTTISQVNNRSIYIAAERKTPFKYYSRCQDLQKNATESLDISYSLYQLQDKSSLQKEILSNISLWSLVIAIVFLSSSLREGRLMRAVKKLDV